MSEKERLGDLSQVISQGNHKSASNHAKFLAEAIKIEINKGWILVLPLEKAIKTPDLVISPMGVVEQLGISPSGDFVPKRRITHDLSFPVAVSGKSINSRVIEESLEPCMFGYTILCIIHRIIHLRSIHPFKKIWIKKEDTKYAYKRLHINIKTVMRTGVQL